MLNSSMLKNVQVEPPVQVEPNPSVPAWYHFSDDEFKDNTIDFIDQKKKLLDDEEENTVRRSFMQEQSRAKKSTTTYLVKYYYYS